MIKGKNRTLKKVIKRNQSIEKFDSKKIAKSITEAGKSSGEFDEKKASKLTVKVLYLAQQTIEEKHPSVEDIANIVEEVLMHAGFTNTAKAYILYRDQQARNKELSIQEQIKLTNQYLKKKDWQVNENSNMGYSLQGLNNYISTEVSKKYWIDHIYSKDIRDAYKKGYFHIHDLGSISGYCCGWSLEDILMDGFTGVKEKINSGPANHLRTALGQIVNFLYTVQGEVAGACAFSSLDTLLAPFIYYDKLSYKDVKQAIQEFIFNMNVPTRVGFQQPFTNVTLDVVCSPNYVDKPVIIGGKYQDKTYKEFQKEMDMFNQAFWEVMYAGDHQGALFHFPIPTINITKEFDWNNKNLDIMWKATSKYGIPYFGNYINSNMSPKDSLSMCCRLKLDLKAIQKRNGGLFGSSPLTGSVGVVTINFPRLAYESKGNEKDFFTQLEHYMTLAKDSLELKRQVVEKFTDEGLYPYTKFYLRKVKERFGKYWTNHFSTIATIGINEACINLFGEDLSSDKGIKFTQKVLDFMVSKALEFQTLTGNLFNIEAAPSESTCYRLALKDKEQYPDIKVANEEAYNKGAAPYYTNSTNLPVNYSDDLLRVLDIQDKILPKYTGGSVHHIFLGESIDDFEVTKKLIRKVCENYSVPYFSISPTFSVCPIHGYLKGEHEYCPKCDEEIKNKTEIK